MKPILEIYDKNEDSWSRIEGGNWKNLKELKLHIEILKKQDPQSFYFIIDKRNNTHIPEEYKFGISGFYAKYNSLERRNEVIKKLNKFGMFLEYEFNCPLII